LNLAWRARVRDGRAGGDIASAHSIETQTDLLIGAFYALMLNFANLDEYPLRRQALAMARFLAEALAGGAEQSPG
jgi:hypothetical protein